MSLLAKYMPRATPLDPAEDPPGSVDPLGTLGPAERIAEVLFPGFTARMWRPRLLTFAALSSIVAERVKKLLPESDDVGMTARLGFERLFVSSVVRQQENNPESWRLAVVKFPGSTLARRALRSGDMPLSLSNFLKGQAANGPYGVIARLARNLGILDEDDRLGHNGEELLLKWSADEGLPGLLDEYNSNSPGKLWLDRYVQETIAHVTKGHWRNTGWTRWHELAERLRLDNIGRQERCVIRKLLDIDPIRARCLELLCKPNTRAVYRAAHDGGRSGQDHNVLLDAVLPALSANTREEDRVIDLTIRLADAYEGVAFLLETAFNCLIWGLTRRGGQAKPIEIESDIQLQPVFQSLCWQLAGAARQLCDLIERIPSIRNISDYNPIEPLDAIASKALAGAGSISQLLDAIITRHKDVQDSKRKGMWIEQGDQWRLMPGFGLASAAPPQSQVTYLHTFRIPNAYSFLGELGLSGVEVLDGEE